MESESYLSLPQKKNPVSHFLFIVVWPCVVYFSSLCLSFLVYTYGIIMGLLWR